MGIRQGMLQGAVQVVDVMQTLPTGVKRFVASIAPVHQYLAVRGLG